VKLRTAPVASLALCALSAFAGTAAAAPGRVPPGNSGAVQYTETLPGVGGSQTARRLREGKGAGRARGAGHALGAADAARLEALGEEGADAARLAAAGSPALAGGGGGAGARGTGGGEGSPPPGGASGLGQVLRAATGTSGSGGMGLLLPLLIAIGVLASLAFLASRRRSAPGQPGRD
jgi:hypothetical protein